MLATHMTPADIQAARALWAEWDAAARDVDSRYAAKQTAWRFVPAGRARHGSPALDRAVAADKAWHDAVDVLDALRPQVADLPDPQELDAFERENQLAAEAAARQGSLL